MITFLSLVLSVTHTQDSVKSLEIDNIDNIDNIDLCTK